jgi:hypothetical protein
MMENVNDLQLEHVNLSMTALHEEDSITSLTRFVRRANRLLHLDLSGTLKSAA